MSEEIDIKVQSEEKDKVVDVIEHVIEDNDQVREYNGHRQPVVKSVETEIIRFVTENPEETLESGFIIYEISKALKQRFENEPDISISISNKFNLDFDKEDIQDINIQRTEDDFVINVEWNQEE